MAYVDLNPIRAGIVATLEQCEFTSIYQRIRHLKNNKRPDINARADIADVPLQVFQCSDTREATIPYRLKDYLALVDWTGRAIRDDKHGHIDERLPPIIQRLNIDADAWQLAMRPRGNVFGRAMGRLNHLRLHATTLGQSWVKGLRRAERLYA